MMIYNILLIFAPNIDCGCLLEPLWWGSSNEYPQSMFFRQNKKINVYPGKSHFSLYVKPGLLGYSLYGLNQKVEYKDPGLKQKHYLKCVFLTHCSLVDFSTLIYWKIPFAT